MKQRSHLVIESPEGSKMEPGYKRTDEQWQLIDGLFFPKPPE